MTPNRGKSLGEIRTEEAFQAARAGHVEKLKWLVECGFADAGEMEENHESLLHAAVRSKNVEAVRYLTEWVGLHPLKADGEGKTPWELAREWGADEVEAYFEERLGYPLENTYGNPVRQGFFPDPSIVRVGQDYYMVNSTFCFFPCIPISHSRDLIHWKIIGHAITEGSWAGIDGLNGGMGYWAPDISYYNGRFFITATLRGNDDCEKRRVQMVTSAERAEGPYEKPVFLDIDGIDPSIFRDDDGKTYMLVNRGARLYELSQDCKEILDYKGLLWYGDNKRKPEGPHLLKKDGYYYLFLAEGGTGMGHCITVARARNLEGPYEPCPHNPLLHQWDEGALIQCTGHGKPVCLPDGRWAMVYLCLRKPAGGYGILGRETCLDPLEWTEDGWPRVNGGRGPSDRQRKLLKEEAPNQADREASGGYHHREVSGGYPHGEASDGCHHKEAPGGYPRWKGMDWMTPRSLGKERLALEEGILRLRGSREDLNTRACRSILVKRQESFCLTAELEMRIPELEAGQSLGMTCYYDENSYIKYGVASEEGVCGILLQEYVDDDYRSALFQPFSGNASRVGDRIRFRVRVDGLKRIFSRNTGEGWQETAALEDTSYLSSEGLAKGKRFTGATLGMYVQGEITGEFLDWGEEQEKNINENLSGPPRGNRLE